MTVTRITAQDIGCFPIGILSEQSGKKIVYDPSTQRPYQATHMYKVPYSSIFD
jgi:hypothetical protein